MGEAAPVNPSAPLVYRSREPKNSKYYQCVEDHFETFEQVYDELFSRKYGFFRSYTRKVIYRYLDCGDLHHGFARVKCPDCGHEYLLAFSCKRRHPGYIPHRQSPVLITLIYKSHPGMRITQIPTTPLKHTCKKRPYREVR